MIDLKHLLFSFKGRIGRQYWWFASLAVAFIAGMANSLIEVAAKTSGHGTIDPTTQEFEPSWPYVVAILVLGLLNLWISCAIAAKRLHDRDRTGWWLVVPLLAIAAAFAAIAWASNMPDDQSTPYFVIGIAILLAAMAMASGSQSSSASSRARQTQIASVPIPSPRNRKIGLSPLQRARR